MRSLLATCAVWVLCPCPLASAADWIVDASGVASNLVTIEQAMVLSSPGDRILVKPGSYPAFHFSRGVDVIGLGTDPGQVQIERVDFHVNLPILDFEAGLENVSVCGVGPGFSISGNELSSGTLIVTGARLCGGVFLGGAGSTYVMIANSELIADPGDGFQGAAVDLGGGVFDLVDTRIVAADASVTDGTAAGIGLRLRPGSVARLSGCEILGGNGAKSPGLQHGGAGIVQGPGAAPVKLRLSGGTNVQGGHAPSGTGGAGVAITGTIELGDAQVLGGQGSTDGDDYGSSQPIGLGFDPHLRLVAAKAFAESDAFLRPNENVKLVTDSSLTLPMLGIAHSLAAPSTPDLSPLTPGQVRYLPSTMFGIKSPGLLGPESGLPAKRVYAQVFFPDPSSRTGALLASNPVSITVAH